MTGETRDFIEIYPEAVPLDLCRAIVRRFDAARQFRGVIGNKEVHTDLKNSWDIGMNGDPEWRDFEAALNTAVLTCVAQYVKTYPQFLLSPVMLRVPNDRGGQRVLSASDLLELPAPALSALIVKVFRPGQVCLQKYLAGEGGYPYWHSEIFPSASGEALRRVLLWTLYLNEEFSDGETQFLQQKRAIKPVTGTLLLAPGGFTHTHRGNTPMGGDKYIATSWILFREAPSET
jgi:hypothetical protein